MQKFLDSRQLLSEKQSGYRKGRSTTTTIYQFLCNVIEAFNNREHVAGMFVDLSKAFDRVDHGILLAKLEKMGFRGQAGKLLRSYLENRKQCLVATQNGKKYLSTWETVNKGVPQGSILGPLLFILYTNNLPNDIKDPVAQFADDTSVTIRRAKINCLRENVGDTLGSLIQWFSVNNMKLNVDKTSLIKFSTQPFEPLEINFKGEKLSSCTDTLFLGLKVDFQLTWKTHVDYLVSKLGPFNYALKMISTHVNVEASLCGYYAYVQSRLKYGVVFWGNSVDVNRVFVLQKKCLRSVFHLNARMSCKNIFRDKKIHTVPGLYIFETAVFVKINYEMFFKKHELAHCYNTRGIDSSYLNNDFTKLTKVQKNVTYQSIKIFNHIPKNIRELTLSKFKIVLARYLYEKSFYNVQEFYADKSWRC